jgi:hypothetical protein
MTTAVERCVIARRPGNGRNNGFMFRALMLRCMTPAFFKRPAGKLKHLHIQWIAKKLIVYYS